MHTAQPISRGNVGEVPRVEIAICRQAVFVSCSLPFKFPKQSVSFILSHKSVLELIVFRRITYAASRATPQDNPSVLEKVAFGASVAEMSKG